MPMMPLSNPAKVAIGAGVAVGGFFAYHYIRKYLAQRKLDKLRALAAAGLISPREFLDAALATGQPNPDGPRITVQEATRLSCDVVFPPSLRVNIPGVEFDFAGALAEMRRRGTCL